MLIEFSVTNYRSIRERQTLNMTASSYFKELEATNTLFSEQTFGQLRLLRSSVIYGPNASGKSTLIQALRFMRDQVVYSQKESQAGDEINVVPFKLSADTRIADSEFEITFVEQNVRHDYGFRCNSQCFTEEWLIAYPLGRPQKWFHRVFDATASKDLYKFSASFHGGRQRQAWADQTRPNALFLSTAVQLNNLQLKPVFDWFKKRLRVLSAHPSPHYTAKKSLNSNDRQQIIELMNSAGLSVADIQIKERSFSADLLPEKMPIAIRDDLLKDMAGRKFLKISYLHHDEDRQNLIEFAEEEESDGTRALFAFAGPWLDVIENDRVLAIDELDSSLHPLLVHHMIKRLHQTNTKAQLIFTTHDTTLLSQNLLRRDQVWFMEKNAGQATQLYSLSDFSPRDKEAIERGYLNGRYGGIPFLSNLDFHGV